MAITAHAKHVPATDIALTRIVIDTIDVVPLLKRGVGYVFELLVLQENLVLLLVAHFAEPLTCCHTHAQILRLNPT